MNRFAYLSTFRWMPALIVLAGLLAACNVEGVNSFAAQSDRMLIRNNNGLYVMDSEGNNQVYYGIVDNSVTVPVLTADGSTMIYIDRFQDRLLAVPTDASEPPRLLTRERASSNSVLAWLPSGHLLYIDKRESSFHYFIQVIDIETTEVVNQVEGIESIFVNVAAVHTRPDSDTGEWTVRNLAAGQLRLVFQAEGLLFLYTARESGFDLDEVLPRELTAEDEALLASRDTGTIAGALLTDDGRRLVLRTRTGTGSNVSYSLYAFDLDTSDPAAELVADAEERLDFAISPDGQTVVYEIPGAPPVLVAYDFESGESEPLDLGLHSPNWWR